MTIKRLTFLLFFLFTLLLASCSSSGANVLPNTPVPAYVVSTPTQGNGGVTGRVISSLTGKPLVGEYVFLAIVNYNDQGVGAYFLDTVRSPATKVDSDGYFQFNKLPPHDYVVIIGEPTVRSLVVSDKPNGDPKILKVEAGKTIDIGETKLDFGY